MQVNSAIMISKEMQTEKSIQSDIIGGSVNIREEQNSWYYQKASPENIYVVIRRSAEESLERI